MTRCQRTSPQPATYAFVRFTPIRLSDSRTNPVPASTEIGPSWIRRSFDGDEAGGPLDMLHYFSPEDGKGKVTVYDVMHAVVRTAPFQCEADAISVDPNASSSVSNEMNCVT